MADDSYPTLSFILERPARKKGGDRYKAIEERDFIIYLPQSISRNNPDGAPFSRFEVTFKATSKTYEILTQ